MRISPIAVACSILFASPVSAAPLSLGVLLQEAEKNNPGLISLRQRAEAAQARIQPAAALPDPRLSAEWMDVSIPGSPKIQVSQMFMFPGKLGKMGDMEARMAEMASQEYESRRWMIASEVKGAYYDLYNLARLQEINRESQTLLKDMIKVTNARYAVGQGMQADVIRPQLQLTKLMNDQIEYKERLASTFVRLNGLLGNPSGSALGEAPAEIRLTALNLDRKRALSLAEQSPMLTMAQADVARAQAALDLAKLGHLPDFELGAGVTPGSGMEGKTSFSAMAGITLPVWANRKQANQVAEAQQNLAAAQSRLEGRRREIDTQIDTLFNQIERMESQLRLYNQGMIPQARLALKANLAAYQAGRGDYLMLLDSFMALYDHRMEAVMWRSEHEKMVGMLEAQLGLSLISLKGARS